MRITETSTLALKEVPSIEPLAMMVGDAVAEYARIPKTCGRFGISRSRLYREAALGNIKLVKLGNATLVDIASMRAFMAKLPAASLRAPKDAP